MIQKEVFNKSPIGSQFFIIWDLDNGLPFYKNIVKPLWGDPSTDYYSEIIKNKNNCIIFLTEEEVRKEYAKRTENNKTNNNN